MVMKKTSKHNLSPLYSKKLSNDRGVFKTFPIKEYFRYEYPNTIDTNKEIEYLKSLPTNQEIHFVLKADDTVKYFEKELSSKGLNVDIKNDKKLKSLLKSVAPFIVILKYHYDRPRPEEIQDIDYVWLASAQSPAYPSGHSTQARFIALYLADKYPKYKKEILKIGENVGFSRLMARIHYPSDHRLGKKLANHLYAHYQKYTPIREQ
jgi:hypothetical protein